MLFVLASNFSQKSKTGMKCVKEISNGNIIRTKNEKALKLVSDGSHKYAPKHEWRKQGSKRG